jgi:hypothetical protein
MLQVAARIPHHRTAQRSSRVCQLLHMSVQDQHCVGLHACKSGRQAQGRALDEKLHGAERYNTMQVI